MQRIKFDVMKATVKQALLNVGLNDAKADICAQIHTESSCDGIYSHGLNRVARFVDYVQKGWVDINAEPELVKSLGVMEIYDGQRGVGITNALFAIEKATEIARKNGVGIVGLRNTTHWMRGGTYGWKAAEKGLAAICWTNTESCMPAWGAKNPRLGNNPFVMAVPRDKGAVVLDMAMSQYAYGKLQVTRLKGEKLPFPGGYDKDGNLTSEPGPIEESMRILPTGYWKGSGMAVLLDAMAALLSAGSPTNAIDKIEEGSCTGASQIFMVFDPTQLGGSDFSNQMADSVAEYVKSSEPAEGQTAVFYPGELEVKTRNENVSQGIPVDGGVWAEVVSLAEGTAK
ncbi:3-dehydro-L-gulonate 2-dehydrogenase [Pectobacterium parmentieri]|uniref:3-dehydro-L-gulonate 2-dehydrogenase n=1 Tax=Pectobacterium parmentieri TaxID=1905730 RepID=UPI0013742918|nr:3-dehydro-L-gulonate 2-dehydrogenase [Pectobacterium parmentieri]MBI0550245.1 3-dehydro-L-gulonate 2-dehydrogenase [Pectobacterium parmentieri]MBI0558845.1 3-dehydro-L-gulonate 2-dehydrogenase [Pectobacterium parmentieri]MBI0563431.1 3-dehydro-L-gulonate 2-dehydrogenase [Pectobacterium parmentieri]QHQ16842.1 3-dehydro-L-gulonate 2-dehydrogenase [Pectobacterium parmentieri]